MRTRSLVATLATVAVAAAGCGGGSTSGSSSGGGQSKFDLVQAGTLTVCSDVPYPPFEMEKDSGGYTGFDIEMIKAIGDRLGLEVQVKDVSFSGLQSGTTLAAGTCDVAASAMTITDKRKKNLDFSKGYYEADQSLLVPADSSISGIEDLAGKRVGVQQGTTGQDYTKKHAPKSATIVAYPSDAELSSAIAAGNIDAILQDLPPNVQHATKDNPIPLKIVAEFSTNEHYGFAVAEEGSNKLLQAINDALKKLRSNGTYDKLYDKYFSYKKSGSGGSESAS